MIDWASKTLTRFENLLALLGLLFLLVSVVLITIEVLTRYILNISLIWISDITPYMLLFLPFLTAGWLLRQEEHITMDLIENYLSQRLDIILGIVVSFVGIFVCAVLMWYGTLSTIEAQILGLKTFTVTKIPLVYLVFIIPVGFFVFFLEFIRKLYREIRRYRRIK